jgi:hypothetical protein
LTSPDTSPCDIYKCLVHALQGRCGFVAVATLPAGMASAACRCCKTPSAQPAANGTLFAVQVLA